MISRPFKKLLNKGAILKVEDYYYLISPFLYSGYQRNIFQIFILLLRWFYYVSVASIGLVFSLHYFSSIQQINKELMRSSARLDTFSLKKNRLEWLSLCRTSKQSGKDFVNEAAKIRKPYATIYVSCYFCPNG